MPLESILVDSSTSVAFSCLQLFRINILEHLLCNPTFFEFSLTGVSTAILTDLNRALVIKSKFEVLKSRS